MPVFKGTAINDVKGVVDGLEEILGPPVEAYTPPVPPWS
jgi:hypothetical protein